MLSRPTFPADVCEAEFDEALGLGLHGNMQTRHANTLRAAAACLVACLVAYLLTV